MIAIGVLETVEGLRHRIHDTEPGFASRQDYIAVGDLPLTPLPYQPHPDEYRVPMPIDRKTALRHALWVLAGAERSAQRGEEGDAKVLLGMAMGILFVHRVCMTKGFGEEELGQAEAVLATMLASFNPAIFDVQQASDGAHI